MSDYHTERAGMGGVSCMEKFIIMLVLFPSFHQSTGQKEDLFLCLSMHKEDQITQSNPIQIQSKTSKEPPPFPFFFKKKTR